MDFLSNDKMWMCYSCAHEELEGDKVQGKIEKKSEPVNAPKPAPPGDSFKSAMPAGQKIEISEPSAPQDTQWQKKCPMCGGRMDFLSNDRMWMCYSCAYEEPEGDKVQGKTEKKSEPANAPEPAPASESLFDFSPSPAVPLDSNEDRKAKKETSPSRQPIKKKTCPVCHKKMQLHEMEKTWRCPYCEYERRI
jgi:rubrerythrin